VRAGHVAAASNSCYRSNASRSAFSLFRRLLPIFNVCVFVKRRHSIPAKTERVSYRRCINHTDSDCDIGTRTSQLYTTAKSCPRSSTLRASLSLHIFGPCINDQGNQEKVRKFCKIFWKIKIFCFNNNLHCYEIAR